MSSFLSLTALNSLSSFLPEYTAEFMSTPTCQLNPSYILFLFFLNRLILFMTRCTKTVPLAD